MLKIKEIPFTQKELKKMFYYKKHKGKLYWRKNPGCKNLKNCEAGYIDGQGYKTITINYNTYRVHRIIWIYSYGKIPKNNEVDHINHDRLDNKLKNLRLVTCQENHKNKSKSKRNISGYTGISWSKQSKKWLAYIGVAYKKIHLGYFNNIQDAITARKEAELKYRFHENHGKEKIA